MRIFVLNATGQHVSFGYRFDFLVDDEGRKIPGTAKPYRTIPIPARSQIPLGGDWNPVQAQELIQQLERPAAGGVNVSDIRTAKAQGQVRLVWSYDKPIPRAICDDVFNHNVNFLANEGERRRKQMALANSVAADAAIGETSSAFAIEVETIEPDEMAVSPSIDAGYRVSKRGEGDAADAKKPARSRAKKRA